MKSPTDLAHQRVTHMFQCQRLQAEIDRARVALWNARQLALNLQLADVSDVLVGTHGNLWNAMQRVREHANTDPSTP